MKLIDVRHALTSFALLTLTLTGCGDDSAARKPPTEVINIGGGGGGGASGCVQPTFPLSQPNLSLSTALSPQFVTEATNDQATANPGDVIEAQITVNAATRYAFVELQDAWDPIPERRRSFSTWETQTGGNRTLDVFLPTEPTQRFGRYYMKITLCGLDCDDQEVVFDINPDVNSNYERSLFEDGLLVQADRTCLGLIPQGTVLIQ